jgi:hypothetical protein
MSPPRRAGRNDLVLVLILVALAAGAGVLCWLLYAPNPPAPVAVPPANPPDVLARLRTLTDQAYELQRKRDWCGAEKAWQNVLDAIAAAPAPGELAQEQHAANSNRELVAELCKPARAPVDAMENLVPRDPPEKISKDDLLRHYPPGRATRSVALASIKGRGTNRNWGLKATSHFVYCYTVAGEVQVEANDGHNLRFELHLKEVSQTLFHSDTELEVDPPRLPLVELVWKNAEDRGLEGIPEYKLVKKLWELANTSDPKLKKSLTWLAGQVRRAGLNPDSSAEIEMIQKVEKLTGVKAELTYTNGVGVTGIRVLEGKKFDPDALQALAESSSLLLDYFIFPGAGKPVGERWTVRAQDVAGLMPLGYDAEVTGVLTLEREPDASAGEAVLAVKRGELTVSGKKEHADEKAKVFVESGRVLYALKELMVRQADMRLRANTLYRSRDHLLFETEKLRDLDLRATYTAERVK